MTDAVRDMKGWPDEIAQAAKEFVGKYGEPAEMSEARLIWNSTPDGWKRSVITREPTQHDFPIAHKDFLEQAIDYKVPVGMFSTLSAFSGSIVADRTRGEISARCGSPAMNFITINLAHDIITGKRTVDLARAELACLYHAHLKGEDPKYAKGFQFELSDGSTGDADVAAIEVARSATH